VDAREPGQHQQGQPRHTQAMPDGGGGGDALRAPRGDRPLRADGGAAPGELQVSCVVRVDYGEEQGWVKDRHQRRSVQAQHEPSLAVLRSSKHGNFACEKRRAHEQNGCGEFGDQNGCGEFGNCARKPTFSRALKKACGVSSMFDEDLNTSDSPRISARQDFVRLAQRNQLQVLWAVHLHRPVELCVARAVSRVDHEG